MSASELLLTDVKIDTAERLRLDFLIRLSIPGIVAYQWSGLTIRLAYIDYQVAHSNTKQGFKAWPPTHESTMHAARQIMFLTSAWAKSGCINSKSVMFSRVQRASGHRGKLQSDIFTVIRDKIRLAD